MPNTKTAKGPSRRAIHRPVRTVAIPRTTLPPFLWVQWRSTAAVVRLPRQASRSTAATVSSSSWEAPGWRRRRVAGSWINELYAKDIDAEGLRGFDLARLGSSFEDYRASPAPGAWGEHRTTVDFTGDTEPTWDSLAFEVSMSAAEGAIGQPYVSHDIGSFKGKHLPDDLYARWVQFGAFQPILRLHSDHGDRLPWEYGAGQAPAADALRLRKALVPYTYTLARQSVATGIPMVRALYLDYPDLGAAYDPQMSYVGAQPASPLTLKVYSGATGSFTLYSDAGEGLGYRSGEYAETPISYQESIKGRASSLTIGADSGHYPGQLHSRAYDVDLVDLTAPHEVTVDHRQLPHLVSGDTRPGWSYDGDRPRPHGEPADEPRGHDRPGGWSGGRPGAVRRRLANPRPADADVACRWADDDRQRHPDRRGPGRNLRRLREPERTRGLDHHADHFGDTQGTSYLFFVDGDTSWGAPFDGAEFHVNSWSDTKITFTVPTPSGPRGIWHVTPGTTATVSVNTSAGSSAPASIKITG